MPSCGPLVRSPDSPLRAPVRSPDALVSPCEEPGTPTGVESPFCVVLARLWRTPQRVDALFKGLMAPGEHHSASISYLRAFVAPKSLGP